MGWKDFAKDYLIFSRKERVGIIVIIILIFLIWFSPKIFHKTPIATVPADTSWFNKVRNVQKPVLEGEKEKNPEDDAKPSYEKNDQVETSKGEIFYFDPNTLSASGWKKLGLREKTIHTIENFLEKGGHFYKATDLRKIYGLRADDAARLEPFVKLEKNGPVQGVSKEKNSFEKTGFVPIAKPKGIDINSADTTAFINLPGIGSKLAARIVNFREKLGGFYSIEQVGETFGLADTTFQKLRKYLTLQNANVKTVNINSATKDELKIHPYIKWVLANAIVEYRNQHGNFSSLDDLKKVSLITDEVYYKLKPYLSL